MAFFVLYYGDMQDRNDGPIRHAVTAFEAYPTRGEAEASVQKTIETAARLNLQVPEVTIMEAPAIADALEMVAAELAARTERI